MKYTDAQIAKSFSLWQEYCDPWGCMTEIEFNEMSLEDKLESIEKYWPSENDEE